MRIQSPTPQRSWISAEHLGLTAHCMLSTCSFLHPLWGILLTALHFQSWSCSLPCFPACPKMSTEGGGRGYWFCLKYMVCKRESRNVLQWEVPWIGVSSCASHSVPGTQPAQVNSVPRAPTSLPAFLEAHSGLKPVSPLTHSSLTSFWLLAWIMQCTVVGYRRCSALRMRQERGWWRWNRNSGGAKYIPTLAQDPLCDLRHGS